MREVGRQRVVFLKCGGSNALSRGPKLWNEEHRGKICFLDLLVKDSYP